jgi:hypothetical protein
MSQVNHSRVKEVAIQVALVGFGLAMCSFAKAQTKGMTYTGPRANVNVYQKSPDGNFAFCDNDPQARLTKDTYAACVKAFAGAKAMAENCAQGNGEIDGYRRGFSWAFSNSLMSTQKDPRAYADGQNSILSDRNIAPFIQQQAEASNRNTFAEAQGRGASLAIQRFTDFVDSGRSRAGGVPSNVLPNPIPVPAHGSPYQNPYVSLLPGQFRSIDDLINQAQFDANRLSFINRYDPVYGFNRPQINLRGMYFSDGIYNPNANMCGNVDQVFARWVQNDRLGKGVYGGYAPKGPSVAKDGTVPGATKGDAGPGRPGPGTAPTKGDVASGQAAPQEPNLQEIYSRAFRQAYATFSDYYYSQGFYRYIDIGQYDGVNQGRDIGTNFAYQTGRRDAFNNSFFQVESGIYTQNAVNGYDSGFNSKYNEYLNSAQPAFQLLEVVGEVDDGIIQPNERFAVRVLVKNYGGKGTSFPAQIAGNVTESQGFTVQAPALSAQEIVSPISARVAAASGNNASVVLQVAGRELPLNQYVTNQVTPTNISLDASIPSGIAKVTVTVVNHSRVKSYDVVKVNLVDSLNHTQSQNVGFLEAGQSAPVTFTISDYNPLDLIDGKVNLQAQSFLGSLNIGTQSVSVRSANPMLDLALAFDAAVQQATPSGFLQTIQSRIYSEIRTEALAQGTSDYNNTDRTFLASLIKAKTSHAQSKDAQAKYSALADFLEPIHKEMKGPKIRIFGAKLSNNQKYFLGQLDQLRD